MTTHASRWLAFGFLVLSQFMIVLDVSIMNVALPTIQNDFALSISDLQAIVTAYIVTFGGFLLFGGRAADLFGRRLIFLLGIAGFTLVSLLIGIADSAALMVPLRALQGVCAAFMSPAALSLALTMFRDTTERTRAISIWGAVSAGGAIAGLLLGGIFTTYLSWRWNFFVNVPIGLAVIAAVWRLVPAHIAEEKDKTLDLPGAILVTSGLMLLVYTLSHAHSWGWESSQMLLWGIISIGLLVGFVINEIMIAKHPLVPFRFFRFGNVRGALVVQPLMTAALFSMFFFMSLYVQEILHFTPLQAGFAFLPNALLIGTGAILAPRAIKRVGYKPVIVFTPLMVLVGLFIFSQTKVAGAYLDFLPGLLVAAAGLGFSFVAIAIAATTGIPPQESGLASGLLTTAQQMGGSIGLAILTSVAAGRSAALMTAGSMAPHEALLGGFHGAFFVGMAFAFLASTLALLLIKSPSNSLKNLPV